MRFLLALIIALLGLLIANPAYAEDCPEGYRCLTEEQAAQVLEAVKLQNCMVDATESGDVDIQWEPHHIIITEEGQVFTEDQMVGSLKWCTWELELQGTVDVEAHQKVPETNIGFELRIKLGVMWLPTYLSEHDVQDTLDPVVLFEPFHVWQFHPQIHAGLETFGLTLGMDIFKNLDIYAGAGIAYGDGKTHPVIGLSLSLN